MSNYLLTKAQIYVGLNELDGTHKRIIDIYNSIKPLPVGYKMTYTDAWCAAFVSACAWEAGLKGFPYECSVPRMLQLLQQSGLWIERDDHIPQPGDLILYDWQDTGKGDNTGSPDHVGIVEKVTSSRMTIIEGNYSDAVKRRVIGINNKWIRGFGSTSSLTDGSEGGDVGQGDGRYYIVKRGDCLWNIAKKFYNSGILWKEIARANGLSSSLIHPGQKLLIPYLERW